MAAAPANAEKADVAQYHYLGYESGRIRVLADGKLQYFFWKGKHPPTLAVGVCCELQFADGSNVRSISSDPQQSSLTLPELAAAKAGDEFEHGAASATPNGKIFRQTIDRWIAQGE